MRQIVQGLSGGQVNLVEVPIPVNSPSEVLVETIATLVSPGTERMITQLAQSSLISKARARPDLVKQVFDKVKQDGPITTLKTVKSRLNSDLPLGYSGCGIARQVGEYVVGISPGDLVATGGAGYANHADFQTVPGLLCSKVPSSVSAHEATFATVASISLHGLRLGEVQPGLSVVIIGLGLIGQLTARLAMASGCNVIGIDIDQNKVNLLNAYGGVGLLEKGDLTTEAVMDATQGRGTDLVLITAGGKSNEPIKRAPDILRDRGTMVIVGDVAMNQDRTPLYNKELTVKVARSFGPGRYDRSYEEWGIDYPAGYVRFTEGRNMESVLSLLATKRLKVDDLITDKYYIDKATDAYDKLSKSTNVLGILFTYGKESVLPNQKTQSNTIEYGNANSNVESGQSNQKTHSDKRPKIGASLIKIGLIGAGAYTNSVIVPKIKQSNLGTIAGVVSSTGLSAKRIADRESNAKVYENYENLLEDESINTVFVTTPHSSHAEIVSKALEKNKIIWCEKPLALSHHELDLIFKNNKEDSLIFVGFNRRFSPSIELLKKHFNGTKSDSDIISSSGGGSLVINYRVSANRVPNTHWYKDRKEGGRLLGEVCHFIDTCSAIVGLPVKQVKAVGSGFDERVISEDIALVLTFDDGSIASITYSVNGHSSTPKERIEVLGRKKSAVVDDFRSITLDGKKESFKSQDKGQTGAFTEFKKLIVKGGTTPSWVYESSLATIVAASQLTE